MSAVRPWRRVARPLGYATICLTTLLGMMLERLTPMGTALMAASTLLIWVAHRWPLETLVLCCCLSAVMLIESPVSNVPPTAAVSAYFLAVRWEPRHMLVCLSCVATVYVGASMVLALARSGVPVGLALSVGVANVFTLGFGAALGSWVRVQRAYVAEIKDRAARAEATRESEAARRVSEERLRIARDLHDVIAHQVTVISLHTGLASSLVESDPDQARESLVVARTASRRILADIGDLLGMLRGTSDAPEPPQPNLTDIDVLLAQFRESGLEVTLRQVGDISKLDPQVGLVAYQILQEGLTNALRHGAEGRAHVFLNSSATRLGIVVTNPCSLTKWPGNPGHGLTGIRERAAAIGGSTTARRTGGIFRLEATLPEVAA